MFVTDRRGLPKDARLLKSNSNSILRLSWPRRVFLRDASSPANLGKFASPAPYIYLLFTSTSKYWVTRSITALKGKLAQYSIIQNEDLDYADYCTFWEEALDDFLPAGGLQRWGTMLFKELTRSSPDPELDTRTSAKRECVRLSREIEGLGHVVAGLARNVFNIDPFDKDRLTLRAQKIDRTASMLSNIIDELIILHDSGLNHLAEYERDGMLNYQDFRM